MPSQTEGLINELLNEIDSSINAFNSSIPDIQKNIFARLQTLLKDLKLSGDTITNSVDNIRAIGALKKEIEKIILNKNYIQQVADFTKAFDAVSKLQNQYFATLSSDFTASKVLDAIRTDAIDSTVTSLTESGITANVTQGIQGILRTNITSGGKYTDLIDQLRTFILSDKENLGALESYTRTITNDSLHTYSRAYSNTIAADLNLDWGRFTGSMLKTSRPICIAMHKYQFFFRGEIPELLNGVVKGIQTPLGKNGLPLGFKEDTTVENYPVNLNGWNCGHAWGWITEVMVPKAVRIETYSNLGIPFDEEGFRMAA